MYCVKEISTEVISMLTSKPENLFSPSGPVHLLGS